jgi:hypothetical protein
VCGLDLSPQFDSLYGLLLNSPCMWIHTPQSSMWIWHVLCNIYPELEKVYKQMELVMETGKRHAYWYLLCYVLRLNPPLSCAYSLLPNIAQTTDRNKVRFLSPFFPPNSLPSDFHCYQSGEPFLLSEATMVLMIFFCLCKKKNIDNW